MKAQSSTAPDAVLHRRSDDAEASAPRKCARPPVRAGTLTGMSQATKEQHRRERQREYDAALQAARAPVGVLVLFARGREARRHTDALEEAFAATAVEGVDHEHRLPAAVWVALRQDDVDATIDAVVQASRAEMVIGEREELDAGYRLTTIEERRPLPDVELLVAQIAAFLQVPRDVITIIAGWGPDDPRTAAEIETLLEYRFGAVPPAGRSAAVPPAEIRPAAGETMNDQASGGPGGARPTTREPSPPPLAAGARAELLMSSAEFIALLHLTPDQCDILATLVRQANITIIG